MMGSKDQIDYWNRMANDALTGVQIEGPELARLRSQIIFVCKEVERDTRHRCAEMASAMHGEILNSRPV